MAKMLHLRPVNGARILDPDAVPVPEALPVEGKMVMDKPYWRRRLKTKEVELVTAPGTLTDMPSGQEVKASPAQGSQGRSK